jgi:hypothetical protein
MDVYSCVLYRFIMAKRPEAAPFAFATSGRMAAA